jgi:hypothetical protein
LGFRVSLWFSWVLCVFTGLFMVLASSWKKNEVDLQKRTSSRGSLQHLQIDKRLGKHSCMHWFPWHYGFNGLVPSCQTLESLFFHWLSLFWMVFGSFWRFQLEGISWAGPLFRRPPKLMKERMDIWIYE